MRAGQLVPLLYVDGQLELCPMENLFIVSRVEHETDDLFVEELILRGSASSVILLVCSSCGWRCCCPTGDVVVQSMVLLQTAIPSGRGGQRTVVQYDIILK